MTRRVDCTFSISEHQDGSSWILVETYDDLETFDKGFISLDFEDDVTFEEAKSITKLRRDKIAKISYTKLP
jgi:hypothetical protein